jgi:hypothetical protein
LGSLLLIVGTASLSKATHGPEPITIYPSNSHERTETHPLSGEYLLPAGTPCTEDVLNIQTAVELAGQTGRSVMLMPGDYDFGDGSGDGDFVGIFNDVVLGGQGPYATRVKGGFCTIRVYDEVDVTITGIHFDTPVYSAILVPAGNVTIQGNRFTGLIEESLLWYLGGYPIEVSESHGLFSLFAYLTGDNRPILPVPPGQLLPPEHEDAMYNWLLAAFGIPTKSVGTVVVSDNEFNIFGEGPDVLPADLRLHAAGVHFFMVYHEEDKEKSLELTRNVFRNPGSQALRCGGFEGNTVTVKKNVVHQREYGFDLANGPQGIKMTDAGTVRPGRIIIEHNELHTLSDAIILLLGSDSTVKSNTLHMPYPASDSVRGLLVVDECEDMTVGQNTFRGSGPTAISVLGESHHNTFQGNNIATLEASEATVLFDALTSHNLYIGRGNGIFEDLGVNNTIR